MAKTGEIDGLFRGLAAEEPEVMQTQFHTHIQLKTVRQHPNPRIPLVLSDTCITFWNRNWNRIVVHASYSGRWTGVTSPVPAAYMTGRGTRVGEAVAAAGAGLGACLG